MHREVISSVSLVHSMSEQTKMVNDVTPSVTPSVTSSATSKHRRSYGVAACIPLSFIKVRDVRVVLKRDSVARYQYRGGIIRRLQPKKRKNLR